MDAVTAITNLKKHFGKFEGLGVIRLAVFGSVVTGEAKENSDIDILVRFDGNKKIFDNFMDVRFLVEEIFPNTRIDLVLEEALKPAIRERILSEARDVA